MTLLYLRIVVRTVFIFPSLWALESFLVPWWLYSVCMCLKNTHKIMDTIPLENMAWNQSQSDSLPIVSPQFVAGMCAISYRFYNYFTSGEAPKNNSLNNIGQREKCLSTKHFECQDTTVICLCEHNSREEPWVN